MELNIGVELNASRIRLVTSQQQNFISDKKNREEHFYSRLHLIIFTLQFSISCDSIKSAQIFTIESVRQANQDCTSSLSPFPCFFFSSSISFYLYLSCFFLKKKYEILEMNVER